MSFKWCGSPTARDDCFCEACTYQEPSDDGEEDEMNEPEPTGEMESTQEQAIEGEIARLLGQLPLPETDWAARVIGVDQTEKDNLWRVKLAIEPAPGSTGMIIRLPVPVDRARAWGAQVGRRVRLRLSLEPV